MDNKKQLNRIRLRAAAIFVLAFLLINALCHLQIANHKQREQLKAGYTAESTVRRIESQLAQHLVRSNILKQVVVQNGGIQDAEFTQLCQYMMADDNNGEIKAIELAQDGIVNLIYPLNPNEEAMGLNMLTDA